MSIDTDRFAGELRARLDIEELHSTLDFDTVLAGSKRARRRRAVVASTVVAGSLAVAVLAGPPLVDLGQRVAEAARHERLAGIDGVAGDLSEPLGVAWRADGMFRGISEPSGTILLGTDSAFEALDPATGQVRWSVPVDSDHYCSPPAGTGSATADPVTSDGPERVLCVGTADRTLQVRDVATGEVVTTMTVDWPEWHVVLMGGAVVTVGVDEQGRAVGRSTDAETGRVNWSYRGDAAIPAGSGPLGVDVGANAVGLVGASWSMSLDASTGEPLAAGDVVQRRLSMPGGLTAVQRGALGAAPDTWNIEVLASDGAELVRMPGILDQPVVDDGSVPGLVFVLDVERGRLEAIDATTGATLWSQFGYSAVAIVDRHVLATTSSKVASLEATTGEQSWTAPLYLPNQGIAPITDGVNVLTLENADDEPELVARDLATGSVVWAEHWDPGDASWTLLRALHSGDVLATTDTSITMFRP